MGLLAAVAAATAALFNSGCGGGTLGSFSSLNNGLDTVIISPVGGSLTSGSSTATVPANTVQASTTMTLGPASGYPADSRLVPGTAYAFNDGGAFLLQPITFTIGYTLPTGAIASSLTMYTVVNNAWQAVPGSTVNTSNSTVTASIQTSGTYAVFALQSGSTASAGTILFNRGATTASNAVDVMNVDGTNLHTLLAGSAGKYVSTAHYSPSGTTIVYDYTDGVDGETVYSMSSIGSSNTKLAGGGTKPDSTNANYSSPAFSPDGTTIALVSDVTGTPEVYTMTAAGASLTQRTSIVDSAIGPIFFNKAGNIAFFATNNGVGSWYQVHPDGTNLSPINSTPVNITLISPWTAYSPDGSTIATGYLQNGTYDLYLFSLNGSTRTRLTTLSASAILAPHYTQDGSKIVFQATVAGAPSVFTVNVNGTGLNNLTVSNGPDTLFDLH